MNITANNLLRSLWEEEMNETTCAQISELGTLLQQVSTRAAELDDAKLNALMCQLGLYSIADPNSADYDPEATDRVIRLADQVGKPFGERIKAERARLELTREGMAMILNVSARAIQSWENDDRISNPSALTQLGAITKLQQIPTPRPRPGC